MVPEMYWNINCLLCVRDPSLQDFTVIFHNPSPHAVTVNLLNYYQRETLICLLSNIV